jgi:hypothetical protein
MKYLLTTVIIFAASLTAAGQNMRDVDFKNFTYKAYCLGEDTEDITVKNGEYSREKQEDGYVDRFWFEVTAVTYGDLTNDKQDEAVVLSVCNTGGTGNFYEGFVYGMKAGKPVLLAHIPGGDRAFGGLREARVENGLLVVESNDAGENGAACCPEFVVTTKYRITSGKLVRSGPPVSRPLVPTHRVTFAKGTSGSTLKIRIGPGESVRYVLAARGGQALTVSISSDKASLELREEAEITPGINNFLARLPRNGDYTTEITNNSNSPLDLTVNIKIR